MSVARLLIDPLDLGIVTDRNGKKAKLETLILLMEGVNSESNACAGHDVYANGAENGRKYGCSECSLDRWGCSQELES